MNLGDNDRFDVRVNKVLGHLECFAEDIEIAVASYKSDQNDIPIGDILKSWNLCIWTERSDRIRALFNHL